MTTVSKSPQSLDTREPWKPSLLLRRSQDAICDCAHFPVEAQHSLGVAANDFAMSVKLALSRGHGSDLGRLCEQTRGLPQIEAGATQLKTRKIKHSSWVCL